MSKRSLAFAFALLLGVSGLASAEEVSEPLILVAKPELRDKLYGGAVGTQLIFAMVRRPDSPGANSLAVMPGLYVAFDAAVVDRIIESESDHARFMAGLVAGQPGELQAEIEAGAWYVLAADPALVMRKPDGLWEELVGRSQRAANTI